MDELLHLFSTPRPNGSPSLRKTSLAIQNWLRTRQIPFQIQTYTQYPYFFETNGLWMILTRGLLAFSAWLNWGWRTPALALAGLLGGTLDTFFHMPSVTWLGRCSGENILIHLPFYRATPDSPELDESAGPTFYEPRSPQNPREILLSAHYDSKTELLDHRQRLFFLRIIPLGLLLTFLVGLVGTVQALQVVKGTWLYWTGAVLSLPLAVLALVYGVTLLSGRLVRPSPGAVDDGAACIILLKLAEHINQLAQAGKAEFSTDLGPSGYLTIALFNGEEIDRQGSRAYVRSRDWTGGEAVLNLEAMAQDGDYVLWQSDGSILRQKPLDPHLNNLVSKAVKQVTGGKPVEGGPMLSDAASFLDAGLQAAVLGTYDRQWIDRGFHHSSDNLERVNVNRIQEGVDILTSFIERVLG